MLLRSHNCPQLLWFATTVIMAVGAEPELRGMGRQGRLNCAEKQLAVGTGSRDRPACTDPSIHDQVVSCHETRGITGQEQCCLRDIIHAADILQRLNEADDHPEYAEAAIGSVVPRWTAEPGDGLASCRGAADSAARA